MRCNLTTCPLVKVSADVPSLSEYSTSQTSHISGLLWGRGKAVGFVLLGTGSGKGWCPGRQQACAAQEAGETRGRDLQQLPSPEVAEGTVCGWERPARPPGPQPPCLALGPQLDCCGREQVNSEGRPPWRAASRER